MRRVQEVATVLLSQTPHLLWLLFPRRGFRSPTDVLRVQTPTSRAPRTHASARLVAMSHSAASLPRSHSMSGLRSTFTGSLGASSSLAMLNGAKSTKSTCGSQVLSHKSSAPSFSFGSGPARINFTGAAAKGPQILQPSVPSGGDQSPGPIYNPAPSKKWLGDAPHPHFGTQQQRPASGAAGQEISKLTGKSNMPGPGSYVQPSSVGKQALARCSSHSAFSFGTQKQRENAAKAMPSPGPVYEPRGTRLGMYEPYAYSFGNEVRNKNSASSRTPGPGGYNIPNSCGQQVPSTQRSSPAACFGQPSINSGGRGILPLEGRHSPGPVYMNAAACKKQALSVRRSAPHMVFTRAERFRPGTNLTDSGPGPGEYIV